MQSMYVFECLYNVIRHMAHNWCLLGEWVMGGAVHEAEVTTLWRAQHVLTIVYHNHSVDVNTDHVCIFFCLLLMSETQPGSLMSQLLCAAQVIWAGTRRYSGFSPPTFIFPSSHGNVNQFRCKYIHRLHIKGLKIPIFERIVRGSICHVCRVIKR